MAASYPAAPIRILISYRREEAAYSRVGKDRHHQPAGRIDGRTSQEHAMASCQQSGTA
jgi:hypothetical protein